MLWFKVKVLVTQSCPTLCDSMDCSTPGSSVHGVSQARILEWVFCLLLQGIFLTQWLNLGLLHCRQILYHLMFIRQTNYSFIVKRVNNCLDDKTSGHLCFVVNNSVYFSKRCWRFHGLMLSVLDPDVGPCSLEVWALVSILLPTHRSVKWPEPQFPLL